MLLLMSAVLGTAPAFADADSNENGQAQVKNVQTGSRNAATGWVEVMDNAHTEASKDRDAGEHMAGVFAGSAIGVRKGIHRVGAGIIDLATFWIPKKQPLVSPEKARLE
jgi:putative exosortase-associated protein (TIGR04073 family)